MNAEGNKSTISLSTALTVMRHLRCPATGKYVPPEAVLAHRSRRSLRRAEKRVPASERKAEDWVCMRVANGTVSVAGG